VGGGGGNGGHVCCTHGKGVVTASGLAHGCGHTPFRAWGDGGGGSVVMVVVVVMGGGHVWKGAGERSEPCKHWIKPVSAS
jgi:hypothetical protein